MAVVAKTQQHQIQLRRIAGTEALQQGFVGRCSRIGGRQVGGDRMQAGPGGRFAAHERVAHHPGVAGLVVRAYPALVTQQEVHPIPGQALTAEEGIGGLGGAAASQCNGTAGLLREGLANAAGHGFGRKPGEGLHVFADLEVVTTHGSHSV